MITFLLAIVIVSVTVTHILWWINLSSSMLYLSKGKYAKEKFVVGTILYAILVAFAVNLNQSNIELIASCAMIMYLIGAIISVHSLIKNK